METVIASCALQPEAVPFFLEINDMRASYDQLFIRRTAYQATLDDELSSAFTRMLTYRGGEDSVRLLKLIRQPCHLGRGRQAFRILDVDILLEGPLRRQRVLEALSTTKPPRSMKEMESHLASVEGILLPLRGSPDDPSENRIIGMLRKLYEDMPRLNLVFAQHSITGGGAFTLLQLIKTVCASLRDQHKSKQRTSPKNVCAVDNSGKKRAKKRI